MNETGRPPERPANPTSAASDDSRASGGERTRLIRIGPVQRPRVRDRVPKLVIELPFEGDLTGGIRGARDERDAIHMRAWLESDPELRELVDLARLIRDRRAA